MVATRSKLVAGMPVKVHYLGPIGSFTDEAAHLYFTNMRTGFEGESTIREIFRAVEDSDDFGVAPIENSIEGPVNQTLDLLWQHDLKIVGEVETPISHCLLAKHGTTLRQVQEVCSHQNALGQCGVYLGKQLPDSVLHEVESTSRAALLAKKKLGTAAIAGERAAKQYGLKVLARNIQDYPNNHTRFVVISQTGQPRTRPAKTSVAFVTKHRPGALFRALEPFAEEHINLTKIQSRPIKSRSWEYSFFVDFEGHGQDPVPARTLRSLARRTILLKILGSYPRWKSRRA